MTDNSQNSGGNFMRTWGMRLGALLLCLVTVTIVGAYTRSVRASRQIAEASKAAKNVSQETAAVNRGRVSRASQDTPQAGPGMVISEFRLFGPGATATARDNNEFIEVQNNTANPITVTASSGTGFGIAASDGVLRCTIPNATVIPARGHFLCVNSVGYAYTNYPAGNGTTATGDATYTTDIPANAGIALFTTNIPANFAVGTRLDAVGSTSEANTLYKEGTGYSPVNGTFAIEHSFVRLASGLTVTNPPFGGTPTDGFQQDTDDNASDFIFVDTNGTSAGDGQRLGAPGPKNLSSPVYVGSGTPRTLLDTCSIPGAAPNKVRDNTADAPNNSTFGTIDLRRTFTNNTGGNLTRLRFRFQNIATFPAASGIADLRPRTSTDVVVTVDRPPCGSGTSNITVHGTTLEQATGAPATGQPNGGGFNSSMSADTITLGTPLANGASIDLRFLFGIQQTGSYKIAVIAEGLPTAGDLWILQGNTEDTSDFEGSVTPPVIAQQGPLTRQQGSPAINSTIATVSDTNPGTLTVTATPPAGITVSNIVNNVGTVTADVAATCGAALGANTVVLTVTNGSTAQSASTNLTVNVTANSPPVLSYNNPPAVSFGGNGQVNPATGPSDNGTVNTIIVQSQGTFTGIVGVNNTSGIVLFSNAAPVGTSTITIRATDNCGTTTDAPFTITVNKGDTTTAVVSSANPSVFGQPVTFTATVSPVPPASGSPTGSVNFLDGVTTIATNVPLNGSAIATFTTSALSVGTHSITAVYNSDANFNGSTSPAVSQVVNKDNTSTTVASSANPAQFGQTVTFTATVTANPPGSGTPTGTVTFTDGATTLGTGTLNGGGQATFSTNTLSVATHSIVATYGGDGNFNGSASSTLSQVVNKAQTNTALTSSVNPSVFGQAVTFTATVTSAAPPIAPPASRPVSRTRTVQTRVVTRTSGVTPEGIGTPTGTVTFMDGATAIGTANLNGSAVATFTTGALATGTHSITAVYNGDGNFLTSTSNTVSQVVNKANTTTTLASSANPSVFGQTVNFTATVAAVVPGAGVPTGVVTFMDGVTTLGTANLNGSGVAVFSTSALAVGSHSITASYGGDTNFNTSASAPLTQVVNKAATTTVITTSAAAIFPGGPQLAFVKGSVTFTATIVPVPPGAGVPTGTVQFKDGNVNLGGPVALVGGKASVTENNLTLGTHVITAIYSGDGNFLASTGTFNQQVGFKFQDDSNGNVLFVTVPANGISGNGTYTWISGTTVIVSNVPALIEFNQDVVRIRTNTPSLNAVFDATIQSGQAILFDTTRNQSFIINSTHFVIASVISSGGQTVASADNEDRSLRSRGSNELSGKGGF